MPASKKSCPSLCCPPGFLRLWDTSADPWTATSGTSAVLDELTTYWNANMRAQQRTVVYMARSGGAAAGWEHASG